MLQLEPAFQGLSDLRRDRLVAVAVALMNAGNNRNGLAFSRPGPPMSRPAAHCRRQMANYGGG